MADSKSLRARTGPNAVDARVMPANDGYGDEIAADVHNPVAARPDHTNIGGHGANPEPDEDPDTPGPQTRIGSHANIAYSVGAVARHLGVSPATLRTWDRRYGIGPSDHSSGAHRRYDATDIERLTIMRQLTAEGVSVAEAARAAVATDLSEPLLTVPAAVPVIPASTTALVAAARARDVTALAGMLSGVADLAAWWTDLVEPAMTDLRRHPALARAGRDPLDLLRSAAMADLAQRTSADLAAQVIVIKASGERDSLAMHALAAAVEQLGVGVVVLPGDVTAPLLADAVASVRPRLVAVVSDHEGGFDALAELGDVDTLVVTLGRRHNADLGPSDRVRSFSGAVHEIVAVVGAA